MAAFFVLFTACYVILAVIIRMLQTKFSGTTFGAALAYIQ